MEILLLSSGGSGGVYALWSDASLSEDFSRGSFVAAFTLFFFLTAFLEAVFRLFVSSRSSALLALLPASLLVLLLQNTDFLPFLTPAVIAAVVLRLFFSLLIRRDLLLHCAAFLMDGAALFLYLHEHILAGEYATDKLLFVALAVMTLSSMQQILIERGGKPFPLYYFVLLGILLMWIPMKAEPIDWTPVSDAGARFARKVTDLADGMTYFLSSPFDDGTYTAGYSSLGETGGALAGSDRTELILRTDEKPFYTYTDPGSSQKKRVRRTLYLAGGRGADTRQLARFLRFLYAGGVDRAHAAVFSRLSEIRVEYAYLDTFDEIAPAGSVLLFSGGTGSGDAQGGSGEGGEDGASMNDGAGISSGVSPTRHRKGYALDAEYLDIHYGSPALIALIREAENSAVPKDFSYEKACEYARELYGIRLGDILTREEFEESDEEGIGSDLPLYTDISGAGGRLIELARELAGDDLDDYEKCRRIEAYLRQYAYDMNAEGGSGPRFDMKSSEGMANLADRFLFETGSGYCVHFTSSMVMLLRLAGVPARAVPGYRYVFPFEQRGSYEVAGNCAHVWPEAYLENVGWVPFEPTAAYRTAAEYTWHREAPGAASSSEEYETPETPEPEIAPGSQTAAGSEGPVVQILRIAAPVILSILALLAALAAGSRLIIRMRYRLASPEEKLIMDVERIKKQLRRRSGEGFVDRGLMSDYVSLAPEDVRDDVRRVFRAYYRVIYGNPGALDTRPGACVSAQENELARRVAERLTSPNHSS